MCQVGALFRVSCFLDEVKCKFQQARLKCWLSFCISQEEKVSDQEWDMLVQSNKGHVPTGYLQQEITEVGSVARDARSELLLYKLQWRIVMAD